MRSVGIKFQIHCHCLALILYQRDAAAQRCLYAADIAKLLHILLHILRFYASKNSKLLLTNMTFLRHSVSYLRLTNWPCPLLPD